MTLKPANYKYLRSEGASLNEIGPVYADIELLSFDDRVLNRHGYQSNTEIRRVRKLALVNSGAMELVINNEIKELLELPVLEERTVRLPDDTLKQVEMVGPVEVRFESQSTTMSAMVAPDAEGVLLGRLALAGLRIFIDPESKQLLAIPHIPIKRVSLSI